jgi:rare lipoprotein A
MNKIVISCSMVFLGIMGLSANSDATDNFFQVGISSWYGSNFEGRETATGEIFDKFALTAAHPTLSLGSQVKVVNLENQKEVTVKINDRGPYNSYSIIGVSEKAAELLDFKESGLAKVGLTLVKSVQKDGEFDEGFEDNFDEEIDEEEVTIEDELFEESPKKTSPSSKKTEPKKEEIKKESPKKEEIKKVEPKKEEIKKESPKKEETTKEVIKKENPKKTGSPKEETKVKTNSGSPKGFTVQFGVFKSEDNASKFKDLEKTFGQKVYIFSREGSYVVQMGDFESRQEALDLQKKVKTKGYSSFVPKKK